MNVTLKLVAIAVSCAPLFACSGRSVGQTTALAPSRLVARCDYGRLNLWAFDRVVKGANNLNEMPANENLQYAPPEARLQWVQEGAVAFYSPPMKYYNPVLIHVHPFYASDVYVDAIEISNSPSPKPNRRMIVALHFVSNRGSGYWIDFFSTDAEDVCTWWPF
ncbi:MAG TPA: hypothetical protein VID19_06685 [Candidatus Eremiobacteraceae bacterium]